MKPYSKANFCKLQWLVIALGLSACINPQIHQTTKTQSLQLSTKDLKISGIAFITPSAITGEEENKQSLALVFADVLREERPGTPELTLPETLSAINRAGLAGEYQRMFEGYRETGIFDREILKKVSAATGMRYLAQLKLEGFKQQSKDRWGFFGVRLIQTKSTDIRVFMQIWDGRDGSIVWEGAEELNYANDGVSEEPVTFRLSVEKAARSLISRLP